MPITGHSVRTAPGGRQKIWALPESLEIKPLVADLEKAFQVRLERNLTRVRKWFDTDDWRLYRSNLLLFQEHRKWHLMHRDSEEAVAVFSGRKCEMFRNSWDFPVSRMRSLLEPILSIRSVLPLITQESSTICVRILNKDRKTIALVYFDDHTTLESGAVFRSVTLKGMRGYDSDLAEVSSFFSTYGVNVEVPLHAGFTTGVQSIGREPLDYTSKFSVDLHPNMTSRQAMVQVYRQLLETIEHNEKGVVSDLDTEFLHDFRVAIRRTRSGLVQVKKVLPPDVVEKVKNDFSWLGNVTGATRDLDVYLLDRQKYMSRLPEKLRPKLENFFVDIEKRRDKEQRKLVRNLHSKKYREIICNWHEYLQGSDLGGKASNSRRQVVELARKIIFRKYKRVMRSGSSIQRSSPDEDLHRLRIQCKKLRYTLEFFTSLFSAREIKLAIKQLKRLQDNLGTFNDLSVQQDMLREYLAGLKAGSRKNQDLAAAIGGLLTNLHHEQQRVRKGFFSRFHKFSCEDNQLLYAKLFH
jgi:CHAD domain-containing protein